MSYSLAPNSAGASFSSDAIRDSHNHASLDGDPSESPLDENSSSSAALPWNHPSDQLPLFLSEREVAKHLGVCVKTVYNLRRRGELPYSKVGTRIVFHPADVAAYINGHRRTMCDQE